MVNPNMCVNQSRHTVSFSDLAWPETAASFPKAWEVGQYLERYVRTYPGYDIRLKSKVVKTELGDEKWTVTVQRQCVEEPDEQVCAASLAPSPLVRGFHRSDNQTKKPNANVRLTNSIT
jgi:cation diffusion facilitator CzcD-associated flavoprotein CzcO